MRAKRVIGWSFATVAVVLIAMIGVWQFSKAREVQLFGRLVARVDTNEKAVALTFDDGPNATYTPIILSVLKQKGVTATFFLIGKEMEKNFPDAKAIAAAGHEIGNHTFHHYDMTLAGEGLAQREVESTDALIRKAGYKGEILFRPPNCKKLIGLPLYLAKHGRITVTMDVEPESYSDVAADPARITAHVLEKTRPGSIILLHAMYKSRETTREALPGVIDGLRARGYRFVTVSELMATAHAAPRVAGN